MTTRFNTTARSVDVATALQQATPNEKRSTLTASQKEKLRLNAIAGLETKFSLQQLVGEDAVGTQLLRQNLGVTQLLDLVRERCTRYGMIDVFQLVVPTGSTSAPHEVKAETFNLLEDFSMEVDIVNDSTYHYLTYGQDYDVENLRWSYDFLFNSCEPDLRDKIQERMMLHNKAYHGGPLFFYEMIQMILSMNAYEVERLRDSLKNMTMQDFKGEDVEKAITLLRATIKRLKMFNEVPSNISDLVAKVFKSCSVPEFSQGIAILQTIDAIDSISDAVEMLFEYASKQYKKLADVWNVPDNHKSASFVNSHWVCWGCGQRGHRIQQCTVTPEAEKPKIIAAKRKEIKALKANGPNKKSTNPKKIPPKNGESQEKSFDGKMLKWCQPCRRWTNHSTSEHRKDYKKKQADTNTNGGGGGNFLCSIANQL